MPSARENAQAALGNALARLAEMDAVPLSQRARMSYSDADQQYGWNEYRAALLEQIKGYQDTLRAVQASEGPFEVTVGGGWWGPGAWGP